MKKLGLFCLIGVVCSGIFYEKPVYAAEAVETLPSTQEESQLEPEIPQEKPQNLMMTVHKEGVKAGDVLKIDISAEKAEYYEIYIYNNLTNEKAFYRNTNAAGTYQWTAVEGEYTLYFLAGNQNGVSESEKQYLNVEPVSGNWEKHGSKWKYLKSNNTYVADTVLKINGCYYSFDHKGYMETGWKWTNGHWYYFDYWCGMQFGWKLIGGVWYYMDSTGVMQTGWQEIDGKKYFLTGSGAMRTGWYYDGEYWYYLNSSGAMVTGWEAVGSTWYYMNEEGIMLTGWQNIDGKEYFLDDSGAMRTGWYHDGKHWYYLEPSGAMVTGWKVVGSTWYYMNAEGVMQTGWQYIDGDWYLLDSSGGMVTGWAQMYGHWYYMNISGRMLTGWQYISGYKHFFADTGEMCEDLREFVPGPYHIRVNRSQNCVTVYAEEGANRYAIPVVSFLCSTGGSKTPLGTFVMSTQYRWHQLYGAVGQYCSRITGHILFHSIPFRTMGDSYSLMAGQFNRLGSNASAGCVRLTTGDAKWIYDNCNTGSTYINIYDGGSSSPLGRPVLPKIPYYQNWDPTDPAIKG